jgi:hypothetical protein
MSDVTRRLSRWKAKYSPEIAAQTDCPHLCRHERTLPGFDGCALHHGN